MKITHLLTAVSSPKNHKLGAALAAGALVMGLLLGASTAQAATVEREGEMFDGCA